MLPFLVSNKKIELPLEIQHFILNFISTKDMENVKLVCRDFYERCSTIFNKEKHHLVIDIAKLDDEKIYDSMKFSLRRFASIRIHFRNFTSDHNDKTCELLKIIGASVEHLYLYEWISRDAQRPQLRQSTMIKWLNLMPNLTFIQGATQSENIIDDPQSILNLPKLRKVQYCTPALGLKLHQFSASSLISLDLDRIALSNFSQIIEVHHATLRELSLDDFSVYHDATPFRQLNLHKLELEYRLDDNEEAHEQFLFDVMQSQTQLRFLSLGEVCAFPRFRISGRILQEICKNSELKKLEMIFDRAVTAQHVSEMRNLTKLEELEVEFFWNFRRGDQEFQMQNELIFQTLCRLDLPNLKHLRLAETYIDQFSLNSFLDHFPRLNFLMLHAEVFTFTPGNIYGNMVELWLCGYAIDLKPCFIKSMPNLNEIYFESLYPRVSTIRAILKSNAKKLSVTVRLIEGLSSIKEQKLRKLGKKFKQRSKQQGIRPCYIEFRPFDF